MSKILKRTQATDFFIEDTGETVPKNSQLTIDPAKYNVYSRSEDVITALVNNELICNDGNEDLDLNSAVDLLKGYFPKKVSLTEEDPETGGIQFTPRYTLPNWKQQLFEIEFKTGVAESVHEKDINNVDIGWSSLKFYELNGGSEVEMTQDVAGGETDEQFQTRLDSNCIRTDLLWDPNVDYMILSGKISQQQTPPDDLYVWVIGIDLDAAYGGPKFTFAEGGINMSYVGNHTAVGLKGVAGTTLYKNKVWDPASQQYVTLPEGVGTNRVRFLCRHKANARQRLQPIFEIFRDV